MLLKEVFLNSTRLNIQDDGCHCSTVLALFQLYVTFRSFPEKPHFGALIQQFLQQILTSFSNSLHVMSLEHFCLQQNTLSLFLVQLFLTTWWSFSKAHFFSVYKINVLGAQESFVLFALIKRNCRSVPAELLPPLLQYWDI